MLLEIPAKYNILLKPDLNIHKDIFTKIFNEVDLNLPEYIIIDILYKTIHFNVDKNDIFNDLNIYYYKCKMLLCSQCIDKSYQTGYFFAKEYRHKDIVLPKKKNYWLFQI